ncbi:post-PEP-CTERM-1 domain-containing protein [Pelomonas sp. Root1237]|uniref:post-PEP-CTERM-1 domain-containing protein n=1 Tax=Pelomonas sp. Root1237 TaxID=1736434 RepID=UPI000A9E7F2E|nr:hypothetical protein [Pelomonas sp. Root1237]
MAQIKFKAAGLIAVMSVLVGSAPVFAADAVGMRIVRDPVTGQLRPPTADEAKAMDEAAAKARADAAAAAPGTNPDTRDPVEIRTTNGVRYRVNDAFLSYSVVTRKADGSLDMQCVTGKETAEKLVRDPKAAVSTVDQSRGKHSHEEK